MQSQQHSHHPGLAGSRTGCFACPANHSTALPGWRRRSTPPCHAMHLVGELAWRAGRGRRRRCGKRRRGVWQLLRFTCGGGAPLPTALAWMPKQHPRTPAQPRAHRANRSRVQAAHSAAAPAAAASSMVGGAVGGAATAAATAASGAWPRAAWQQAGWLLGLALLRSGCCRRAPGKRQVQGRAGRELGGATVPPGRRAWQFMRSGKHRRRWRAADCHQAAAAPSRPVASSARAARSICPASIA